MSTKKHSEDDFEAAIVASLVAEGGLVEGDPKTFDIEKALFVDDVLSFIHGTQHDKVEKLRAKVPGAFDTEVIMWLCKALKRAGSLAIPNPHAHEHNAR